MIYHVVGWPALHYNYSPCADPYFHSTNLNFAPYVKKYANGMDNTVRWSDIFLSNEVCFLYVKPFCLYSALRNERWKNWLFVSLSICYFRLCFLSVIFITNLFDYFLHHRIFINSCLKLKYSRCLFKFHFAKRRLSNWQLNYAHVSSYNLQSPHVLVFSLSVTSGYRYLILTKGSSG
jgi:hypothetical protein